MAGKEGHKGELPSANACVRIREIVRTAPDMPPWRIGKILGVSESRVNAYIHSEEAQRALARKGNYRKELAATISVAVAESAALLTRVVIRAQAELAKDKPNQSILTNGTKAAVALLHGTGILQVHQVVTTDAPDAVALLEAITRADGIRKELKEKASKGLRSVDALPPQTGETDTPPRGRGSADDLVRGRGDTPSPKIP
jgi:hypothetical protein